MTVTAYPLGIQRLRAPAKAVLAFLLAQDGEVHPYAITQGTGFVSGGLSPMLRRFENAGLLTSRWEEPIESVAEGRPRRRYVRLTAAGVEFAKAVCER